MIELKVKDRPVACLLFRDFPYMHGVVAAVLEGGMGRVLVDDSQRPRVAHMRLDFNLLAGDPDAEGAEQLVRSLRWAIVPSGQWESLVRRTWGAALRSYRRVAFHPGSRLDRSCLRRFSSTLPAGFELKEIACDQVERFAQLDKCLTGNFPSHAAFLEHGIGFGIEHEGNFVAGVSSFAIGGGKLEIEIDTHQDFRRRGLATALGARIIEYCLDNNLKPCWDAASEISALLARKLGFVEAGSYDAFYVQG